MDIYSLSTSARLLYQEAQKRGISCTVFENEHLLQMKKDSKIWYTMGSRTSLQSSVGKTIADQKPLTKEILVSHNIPTAKYVFITNTEELACLSKLNFPLVMKPVEGYQGKDVVV